MIGFALSRNLLDEYFNWVFLGTEGIRFLAYG